MITLNAVAQQNFIAIDSTDTEAEIIHKAAQVTPSARQLHWQQKELTAFFHFGMNTFTGREWGDGKESPALFNPTALDADQWVLTAKSAGFQQVILTAKHHDGFCLWPSKYTEHSVKNSPWKNGHGDVVKEVQTACNKYKIGFGIYLSPWDRNAPMYGTDAYNKYFMQQLTELLTQYGKVDEVWFDGANGEGPNGKRQVYAFNEWYRLIRKLQPDAVIAIMGPDVRWVGTETGYGRDTEWSVVPVETLNPSITAANSQQHIAFNPKGDMMGDDLGSREKILKAKSLVWYPAETDVSIRPGWFYHASEDEKVKTPQQLLDIYFNSAGKNGMLLLNLPPNRTGRIHETDSLHLMEWKRQRDVLFSNSPIAYRIPHCVNGLGLKALTDNNQTTSFHTKGLDTQTMLTWTLPTAKPMSVLRLKEDIRKGQRIEQFQLEAWMDGQWLVVAKGTTVGYMRILNFKKITTSRVRLTILSARSNPYLTEVGVYEGM